MRDPLPQTQVDKEKGALQQRWNQNEGKAEAATVEEGLPSSRIVNSCTPSAEVFIGVENAKGDGSQLQDTHPSSPKYGEA